MEIGPDSQVQSVDTSSGKFREFALPLGGVLLVALSCALTRIPSCWGGTSQVQTGATPTLLVPPTPTPITSHLPLILSDCTPAQGGGCKETQEDEAGNVVPGPDGFVLSSTPGIPIATLQPGEVITQ